MAKGLTAAALWGAVAALALGTAVADAKPARKPAKKAGAAAKKTPKPPVVAAAPGGVMVPKAVVLRPMTSVEAEANALWNLRAALNIAALQCQYSPYLATTAYYYAVLTHHSDVFRQAMTTMTAHFQRYDGPKRAVSSFDQYTTRTYNSFSTLDAQYSFCYAAGSVGRQVLAVPLGQLGVLADGFNMQMRASLTPHAPTPMLDRVDPVVQGVPELPADQ